MPAGDPSPFGILLKRHRAAAGLTQEALAERAHVSAHAVSALERGVNRWPHADTLALLAEALALTAEQRAALEAAARRRDAGVGADLGGPASTPTGQLLGRALELALLDRHLAGQGPPVLLLAGEPGIGKSRLLQEAARRARPSGWRVLAGGCTRNGGQEPYAPLLQALHDGIARIAPARRPLVLRGCAWLARLLPEWSADLPEPVPAWTVSPAHERRLMFRAVERFLANGAGPAGTLLVLDDLHWAGQDALDLLVTLVRATVGTPVRVLGAYRDTEAPADTPLAAVVADLAHAGLAEQHALTPLTPGACRQLLAAVLERPGTAESALWERMAVRTGGVPFFLLSCAQALQRGDAVDQAQDVLPWHITHSVRQRIAALPVACREVLGAAAVLGRRVQPALLLAVTDRPEQEVLAALDVTCRVRLLEEGDGSYQFAHDIIREVVEADLGVGRRVVLHRRVAEALERGPGGVPAAALAYHYSRGGVPDKAVLYLEQAGDQARLQAAHAAAAGYFADLVAHLDALGRALESARAREKLGTVLVTAARYDAALPVLDHALQTLRKAQDLDGAGRVMAQIAIACWGTSAPEEGLARVQSLLAVLEPRGPSPGLAALHDVRAWLFYAIGRHAELPAAAERAADLARAIGDAHVLARSATMRIVALLKVGQVGAVGRVERSIRLAEEAVQLAEETSDLDPLSANLDALAYLRTISGDFGAGRLLYQRALLVAEQVGDHSQMTFVTVMGGWNAFLRGAWGEARVGCSRASVLGREAGTPWAAFAMVHQGQLALAEGEWEEASRCLTEASTVAAAQGDLQALRQASGLLAELEVLAGRPDAARARLAPLLDRPGLEEYDVTALLPVLAWAHLELGEVAQAGDVVEQAIRRTRPEGLRLALVEALRVRAMVAARLERWEEAERALGEGLPLARAMPHPYAEARLLYQHGEVDRRRGERGRARERLAAGLAIFRRLGARKDIERTEQVLAVLG